MQTKFKYLFGPIFSRRLGVSLGIDYLPHKTCNFDCLYCECGATDKRINEPLSFLDHTLITKELDQFLKTRPKLDYITFSGSGEPTLYTDLDKIILHIKNKYPEYKVALLTNSTLLYRENILNKLLTCDLIVPSLDAVSEKVFKKINRPNPDIKISNIIDGLFRLKKEFHGEIWLEVLFVKGVNDSDEELELLKNILKQIAPTKIQLNSVDRPPAYSSAHPLTGQEMESIKNKIDLPNTEIISTRSVTIPPSRDYLFNQTIMESLKRRPCTALDISAIIAIDPQVVSKKLEELVSSGVLTKEEESRGVFYKIKNQKNR